MKELVVTEGENADFPYNFSKSDVQFSNQNV